MASCKKQVVAGWEWGFTRVLTLPLFEGGAPGAEGPCEPQKAILQPRSPQNLSGQEH